MIIGEGFTYNGINTVENNYILASLNTHNISAYSVGLSKDIETDTTGLNPLNKIKSVKYSKPLEFGTQIFKNNGEIFNINEIETISTWLDVARYTPLCPIIDGNISSYYYNCIPRESLYIYNGHDVVGIEIKFVCDAPYAWEYFSITTVINKPDSIIEFNNTSDDIINDILPILTIVKNGTGEFSIVNSDDVEFNLSEIMNSETIVFNEQNMTFTSSINNRNMYDVYNRKLLRLKSGVNTLTVNGNCTLTISGKFARKVGFAYVD